MMGEIHRQLASAQLRGKLYKTGYRRTKVAPKEMQGGVTGQTSVMTTGCGVSAVATGTPGLPIPGTPQLRTPPRLLRLVTMSRAPVSVQTAAVSTLNSLIPQTLIINISQIQDKTPQPVTTIKQEPPNLTMAAPAQKVAIVVKRRGRPKAQPVATCQVLYTIEEVNEEFTSISQFGLW